MTPPLPPSTIGRCPASSRSFLLGPDGPAGAPPNRKITSLSLSVAAAGGAGFVPWAGSLGGQAAGARVTVYPSASSCRTWPRVFLSLLMRLA